LLTGPKHYNHLANQATAAKRAEYDAWIHSYTPAQIHAANLARAQLRKKLPATKSGAVRRHTAKLVDDRRIKRPVQPYTLFTTERHSSGDMKGILITDASKIIAAEWKALSASEKKVCTLSIFQISRLTPLQKYEDQWAADTARFKRDSAAAA
jgi:hypothetical protein